MEKQKMALMAVGFILIALASFFITKEQSDSVKSYSTAVKEKNVSSDKKNADAAVSNNQPQPKNTNLAKPEKLSEESADTPAQAALKNYYKYITEKKFREAYNSLTWEMQNQMGTYESFANDYDETISSTAKDVKIISSNDTEVVLKYDLIARDKFKQNRIKVQTFSGVATMKFENNVWLIDNLKVKKDGEYLE